jgi:hypothetical protein
VRLCWKPRNVLSARSCSATKKDSSHSIGPSYRAATIDWTLSCEAGACQSCPRHDITPPAQPLTQPLRGSVIQRATHYHPCPLVIVDQQTVEAIRSARLRLREITLPVVYGSQGERKKCPMREGKAVTLTARVPSYAKHRKAVLGDALGPVCLPPRKSVVVTPVSVVRDGAEWRVRFEKGAHEQVDESRLLRATSPSARTCSAILTSGPRRGKVCGRAFPDRDYLTDRPITVCACGAPRPSETIEDHGYTARRMVAMRSEGEAVPEDTQKQITAQAELNAENGYIIQRERLMAAVSAIRPYAKDAKTIKHLQGVERQLRSLVKKMAPAA